MKFARLLVTLSIFSLVGGCAGGLVKEKDIVEIDPSEIQLPPDAQEFEPTEPLLDLGANNEVVVTAARAPDVEEEDNGGNLVNRQIWEILVTNQSPYYHKCVAIAWRLMDFKLHTERETEFLVAPETTETFGTMVGQVWVIDGVRVAPPPSGYIHDMRVRKPVPYAPEGEECLFLSKKIKEQ